MYPRGYFWVRTTALLHFYYKIYKRTYFSCKSLSSVHTKPRGNFFGLSEATCNWKLCYYTFLIKVQWIIMLQVLPFPFHGQFYQPSAWKEVILRTLVKYKSDFIKTLKDWCCWGQIILRYLQNITSAKLCFQLDNYYVFVNQYNSSGGGLLLSVTLFSFLHTRCTFPQELPAGVQEDPEPSLQGVCACLHSSLWQHLQHGCRGPHQYLLQALLLLHLGVQPHWSLWTGATGETIVWPRMCEGVGERGADGCFVLRRLSVSLS